jgi:hypothetical protein
MGTSTGDIVHGSEQNNERPESGPGELLATNDGAEPTTTTSALQNGKLRFFILKFE